MKHHSPPPSRLERVTVVIHHAEVLADEASDAQLFDIADRLRLYAARLAIDIEEAETALARVQEARVVRRERASRLRQASARLDVELEERLPTEESAALVAGLRGAPDTVTRFRLKRLSEAQRALLGDVVNDCEHALLALEVADDRALEAAGNAFVTRVRALGRAHALRRQLHRDKNAILAVLPTDSIAAARVRRYVVRTRSAESYGRFVDLELG